MVDERNGGREVIAAMENVGVYGRSHPARRDDKLSVGYKGGFFKPSKNKGSMETC